MAGDKPALQGTYGPGTPYGQFEPATERIKDQIQLGNVCRHQELRILFN